MTNFSGFALIAALLLVVVLVIILRPLLRSEKSTAEDEALASSDQREANLDIYREQLADLEHDRVEGSLAEADYLAARGELQRRLLDEVQPDSGVRLKRGGRGAAYVLLLALPLLSVAGYLILGRPQALDPASTQPRMNEQQIDSMLVQLEQKLKAKPDDHKGWVMLARSYKVLGRFAEAAQAYSHGGPLLEGDATLLADYAEVLAQANRKFDGKPMELIAAALKIDPAEPQALFLAGAAASERRDFAAVVDYWGRLLPQLEAGSEEAKSLGEAVDKARAIVEGKVGTAEPTAQAPETVSGEVALSGKVAAQAKPDDLLFVFARPDEGSRMPLAVVRAKVADLPLQFSFDDSMALSGGQKISDLGTISIEARVAKAGKAQSSSGDLFGIVKGVKPGTRDVKVVIDQVQP
ncbi:MAG: c-type cytochrome biogenesis protein CcmI [Propionivibrio sp.]|nr:c-type cytochrome biogenesis protein CcmI [Propionivibrio sp.]